MTWPISNWALLLFLLPTLLLSCQKAGEQVFISEINLEEVQTIRSIQQNQNQLLIRKQEGKLILERSQAQVSPGKLASWLEKINQLRPLSAQSARLTFTHPSHFLILNLTEQTLVLEGVQEDEQYGIRLIVKKGAGESKVFVVSRDSFNTLFFDLSKLRSFKAYLPPKIEKIIYKDKGIELSPSQRERLLNLMNQMVFKTYAYDGELNADTLKNYKIGMKINNNLKSPLVFSGLSESTEVHFARPALDEPSLVRVWSSREATILEGEFNQWAELLKLEEEILSGPR